MLRRLGVVAGQSTDIPPSAPTITSITPGNGFLAVNFSPPSSDGGRVITNYQFSINNGALWTTRSPASASSPITISGLTNGVTYSVVIRAINLEGPGATSNMVSAKPFTTASAPQSVSVTNGGGGGSASTVSISFSTPISNGGDTITNYQYSLNGGSTWITRDPVSIISPLTVSTGLSNSTVNSVGIRAVNDAGGGTSSGFTSIRPLPSLEAVFQPTTPTVSTYTAQSSINDTTRTVGWEVNVRDDFSAGSWVVILRRASNNSEIMRTTTRTAITKTDGSFSLPYSTYSSDFNTNVYIVVLLTDSAGQTSSWQSNNLLLPAVETTVATTWSTQNKSITVAADSDDDGCQFYPLSSGTFGLQRPQADGTNPNSTYLGDTASTAPAWDRNSNNEPITTTKFQVGSIFPAQSNTRLTEVFSQWLLYEWQISSRFYNGVNQWQVLSNAPVVESTDNSAGLVRGSASLNINSFRTYSGQRNRTFLFFFDINGNRWRGSAGTLRSDTTLSTHNNQSYAGIFEETDIPLNAWKTWTPSGASGFSKSTNDFGQFFHLIVSIVQRSNSSNQTQMNGAEPGFVVSFQVRESSSSSTFK
jgi:hypothetical protein